MNILILVLFILIVIGLGIFANVEYYKMSKEDREYYRNNPE